ncbi:MAG: NAD-dependent epimerase/dehydratase family protein [Planctomycetaceae bacterium]|nr:NAD-dependent epimerase/dehydratase family protein [Planctomycetaceae bacterium]
MNFDRRRFLTYSSAAAALLGANSLACQSTSSSSTPPKKLKILILGGTGFVGPALVEAATPRGHEITLFNRGKTNPGLFPELEKLQGDRDPLKGEGIKSLAGRQWDVVFDDCGYYPRHVKASAELLAPNVGHYVYVSSISCYARNDIEGMDETAECGTMPDPTLETMGKQYEYYGPLKALCEQAAEAAFPGRACIVRPGYIVGPGDPTDRFTYWPARADKGGEMAVPGAPSDPIQVIDVRDLAEWMVHVAEQKTTGRFNACGPLPSPSKQLDWGEVIRASLACTGNKATPRWVPLEVLEAHQPAGFHIWAPFAGESKGFHRVSNVAAMKAGLKFRTIDQTTSDTLAWFKSLPPERQKRLFDGAARMLTAEKEAELCAAVKKA